MENLKKILISFATTLITIIVVYGGYSTFAQDIGDVAANIFCGVGDLIQDFDDGGVIFFWQADCLYHAAMNSYFNEKFEKLDDFLEENEDFFKSESRKYLTPPKDVDINICTQYVYNCGDGKDNDGDEKTDKEDPECFETDEEDNNKKTFSPYLLENGDKGDQLECLLGRMDKDAVTGYDPVNFCDEQNLSSYCVSLGALDLYMRYVDKLDEIQARIPDTNDVDCVHRSGLPIINMAPLCANFSSLENLLGYSKERNEAISAEYDAAKQTMELTVSAYNELILAYPMHKKYNIILAELTKYKGALQWFNVVTMIFPTKFMGTSSASCS